MLNKLIEKIVEKLLENEKFYNKLKLQTDQYLYNKVKQDLLESYVDYEMLAEHLEGRLNYEILSAELLDNDNIQYEMKNCIENYIQENLIVSLD